MSSINSFDDYTDENNAAISIRPSEWLLPKMEKGELMRWMREAEEQRKKGIGATRFLIPNFIDCMTGKIDEKIDYRHVSDTVVWNLIYIKNKDTRLPTTAAPERLKYETVGWLKSFRSQLLEALVQMAKTNYVAATKTDQWNALMIDAGSFGELCKLTGDETGEQVCKNSKQD